MTDGPGLGEVVRDGITGLRVGDDVGSIAEGIVRLLGDAPLRGRLGAAASAWVRANVSLERVLELEAAAHSRAIALARSSARGVHAEVRFAPTLTGVSVEDAVSAWKLSLAGFARRLCAKDRARFLAGLDAPLYEMQGSAAIEGEGGLHPKHRLMRYHDFFVERIKPGERVVDLGCGVGALACAIARRAGARVLGMDWSERNLGRAREAAVVSPAVDAGWMLGDITKERASGRFDAVVLSNVLEHLQDRPALLARYREWYEPSRFLIRVPAFEREWRVPWKKELGVEWRLDPTHETEYTESQLRSELREAGLRVTELIARWGEFWCVAQPG